MVRHAVAFQFQQAAGTVVDCLVLQALYDCQPTVALEDETVVAYVVLAGEAPVGQMGLAYKDRGQKVAIIGIEERIERVGMGRLGDDDIVP